MTLYEFFKTIIVFFAIVAVAPIVINTMRTQYNYLLEPSTCIGILSIKGAIVDSSSYTEQLHSFFKDASIKGIILKIECFECAAGTSQTIFNEIQQGKKAYPKPIITLIENVCVAGGYLIASASDFIIASETAILGGIGSYAPPAQLKDFFDLMALTYCITTEPSNTNHPIYNDIYQQCIKHIATARKLSLATVSNWAQEKLFTGKQACSLGLVNMIGSMYTVISLLKEKALIDGEIVWIEKKESKNNIIQFHSLQQLYSSATN